MILNYLTIFLLPGVQGGVFPVLSDEHLLNADFLSDSSSTVSTVSRFSVEFEFSVESDADSGLGTTGHTLFFSNSETDISLFLSSSVMSTVECDLVGDRPSGVFSFDPGKDPTRNEKLAGEDDKAEFLLALLRTLCGKLERRLELDSVGLRVLLFSSCASRDCSLLLATDFS